MKIVEMRNQLEGCAQNSSNYALITDTKDKFDHADQTCNELTVGLPENDLNEDSKIKKAQQVLSQQKESVEALYRNFLDQESISPRSVRSTAGMRLLEHQAKQAEEEAQCEIERINLEMEAQVERLYFEKKKRLLDSKQRASQERAVLEEAMIKELRYGTGTSVVSEVLARSTRPQLLRKFAKRTAVQAVQFCADQPLSRFAPVSAAGNAAVCSGPVRHQISSDATNECVEQHRSSHNCGRLSPENIIFELKNALVDAIGSARNESVRPRIEMQKFNDNPLCYLVLNR